MLKKLFSRQPGGLIQFYGLSEWYTKLSYEEQSRIKHYYSIGMNTNPRHLDSGNVSSSASGQNFLANIGLNAVHNKDYAFADVVLTEALKIKDDNPVDRHFVYNALIDLYYKQRDVRTDAIDRCVKYCLKDIEQIGDFIDAWRKHVESERTKVPTWRDLGIDRDEIVHIPDNEPELPRIPSFERLAIIYEKQGNYQSAISVCQRAINLGLHDSTKGGFSARLTRLRKKMSK